MLLDRERPIGFSTGYIPLRAILDYGNYISLDPIELDELVAIIQMVDNALMKYRSKDA